jgi:hypothetical protein
MRAVATKEVGRKRSGRTALGRLFFGVAAVLVLTEWGCGSGEGVESVVGGEAALAPTTPRVVSVAGNWRGEGDSLRLSWRLTQEGESVNGTSQVAGGSGWSASEGRVVGKVSGYNFSFSDTHASGSSTTANCDAELEGTLELRETAPVGPAPAPYPSAYPMNPPPMPPRMILSGFVEGSACGKPFSGMVTLTRE